MARSAGLAAGLGSMLAAVSAWAADPGTLQREDGFRDAVTAPLEDVNLKQTQIPAVLVRAVADPYDLAGLERCEGIAAEVGRIDAALGPDLDEAPPPDARTRAEKLGGAVKAAGVATVRDHAREVLPFRGWLRKLSGAERHEKKVAEAIRSGGIRRGYLKGVGMKMNCAPPAAPSWFVPAVAEPAARSAPGGLGGLWARLIAWIAGWWPF